MEDAGSPNAADHDGLSSNGGDERLPLLWKTDHRDFSA